MSGIIGIAGTNSGVIPHGVIDYEEGTWTPGITNGTAYTAGNQGRYVKIGRQVTVHFYCHLFSRTSDSTEQKLTGLPFNVADDISTTSMEAFGTGTWNGMTASNWTSIIYAGIHDTTTASIHNGEGGADIQNSIGSDFANGSYIRGTITYTTN